MRRIHVIGIGTGDPDHLTVQAIRVLRDLDVVFVVDKGEATAELVEIRRAICAAHIARPYRTVVIPEQSRDREPRDYVGAVEDWYDARAGAYEAAIDAALGPEEHGGILVWGDPALFDSTLRVLDRVAARGKVEFVRDVVPGVSSLQVLAARHGVTFTGVGAPVHVTTGRRLADGMPAGLDHVWVMLDSSCAFARLPDTDLEIFWGAYVGMPDEILVAGDLQECAPRIVALRAEARARKGWVMDSYLLRRRGS